MLVKIDVGALNYDNDSIAKTVHLEDVLIVKESYQQSVNRSTSSPVAITDEGFFKRTHFTGNLMQTLEHFAGYSIHGYWFGILQADDSAEWSFKPCFCTENGIRQEGQQWGADHGLEIDAFNIERITIRKRSGFLYCMEVMPWRIH